MNVFSEICSSGTNWESFIGSGNDLAPKDSKTLSVSLMTNFCVIYGCICHNELTNNIMNICVKKQSYVQHFMRSFSVEITEVFEIHLRESKKKLNWTAVMLKLEYFRQTRLIPWLLMPWLLVLPGCQPPWYWLLVNSLKLSDIYEDFGARSRYLRQE